MIRFTPFLVCALLAKASFATQTTFTDPERQASDACLADAISCHVDPSDVDSCCVETPGGLLMQTQFWNYNLKKGNGPVDSWTIHGLWADGCDGTVDQDPTDCGEEFGESEIRNVLAANGKQNLLKEMDIFWLGIHGNEHLWAHEWNKHGRCMSTLARNCLPNGSPKGLEAAIFFQRTVDEFNKLTTYDFLADAGIVPHETKTYRLDDLNSAFENTGYHPVFECDNHHHDHSLSQIQYYFNLNGTIADGNMIPIRVRNPGNCPEAGIRYPPKMH